ncbi:unnamed protein product [Linum tenue]|uniref:Sugar phosphate transporter domain-containing protein n=2 Tax=Linum tenue TaxID=586396 RepID=A0AAV0RBY6_9ROSI|nr:unnamed protein product [Linum tenue]
MPNGSLLSGQEEDKREMLSSREILNFLVRKKDARKILKRKDSDAGERGRALEELRSSLFNKLRSPEGAKRQEQRYCGPIAALTFNFVIAVGIIFINKWVSDSPPCVGFYQMAKIAVTPSIVLAEFIWLKKRVSFSKVVALTVASTGVAVATVTDLQFSLFGACVALAWIVPSAVNKILWSTMQQRDNWTALALMWKTTPITLVFLTALIPFLDPPGVFSYDWTFSNTTLIITSALFGFLLQWSGALALGATSPVSHVVLGQFKTCIVLLGNYYIFGSNPGVISIFGALIAIGGMSGFTYLNLQNVKSSSSQTAPQKSSSKDKSRLSKENGGDDGNDAYGEESV